MANTKRNPEPGFNRRMDLNQTLLKNPAITFYLRVTGDSMTGAGIYPDDLLIVERGADAKDGDIIIAQLDGVLYVARLEVFEDERWLASHRKGDIPTAIAGSDDCEIWGRVTYSIHSFEAKSAKRRRALKSKEGKTAKRQTPSISPTASRRIKELRARLDNLYEPENEAARFKVLREIYDLEHPTEDGENDWPEIVTA